MLQSNKQWEETKRSNGLTLVLDAAENPYALSLRYYLGYCCYILEHQKISQVFIANVPANLARAQLHWRVGDSYGIPVLKLFNGNVFGGTLVVKSVPDFIKIKFRNKGEHTALIRRCEAILFLF